MEYKMKYVYHGSNVANLETIKCNRSTHLKKWVYATYSEAIATIFLSPYHSDYYYHLSGDGIKYPIELVERKKGMFKKIFNCSGYIYTLNDKNFKKNMTNWSAEVISEKEEKVVSCKYIDNVYNEIINLAKKKKLKLYLYPDRPKHVPIDNSDLIKKVINWKEKGLNIDNFFKLYPELLNKYQEELKKEEKSL